MPAKPQYKNTFPDTARIEQALTKLLAEKGGVNASMPSHRVYRPLGELLGVSDQAMKLTRREYYTNDPHDGPAWDNLVQWAVRQLRKSGRLRPASQGHGHWTLSARRP